MRSVSSDGGHRRRQDVNDRVREFKPLKQRARSREMHGCIINAAQESDRDRKMFKFLGGNVTLKMQDPSNANRLVVLKPRAPASVACQRPQREGALPREQLGDDARVATTIELDHGKGGLSLAGLEALKCYLQQPRSATAARYVGVSQRYAASVLGAWQTRGEVPPARQSSRGSWDRDGGDAAVLSQFTREQVQSIRMWIIEEARAGRNVFSRGLRAQIQSLTGHVLSRRKLQAMREPLGIVFSNVVGAGGAKLSRRVRRERYRFIVRRMNEDAREPHLRPIRVYSDETS